MICIVRVTRKLKSEEGFQGGNFIVLFFFKCSNPGQDHIENVGII